MKKLIKPGFSILCLIFALFFCADRVSALSLSESELKLMNAVSRFIDHKPEGQSLRLIESAMKSPNASLRGLTAIILFKHYGENFHGLLLRNFTLNPENDRFAAGKKVLVKLENLNRLLATYDSLLEGLKDERARQLFLFFHFRHKQVSLLGASGEQLSLAAFYRIGLFEAILGREHDAIAMAAQADK